MRSIVRTLCLLPLLLVASLLLACQPEPPLPTLARPPAVGEATPLPAAEESSSPTAAATPARGRPTLPPTFTPTDTPTATATGPASGLSVAVGEPAAQASRLFYIHGGEAVISLAPDGAEMQPVIRYGPGQTISGLAPSPDGRLLAFVAPGAGSAREVYVASLDGTYIQQVSCLGFAEMQAPVWHPDGETLTFFAAPLPGAAGGIYTASYIGSNDCPTGNNQRELVALSVPEVLGYTWNRAGDLLIFGNGRSLSMLDPASGRTVPMTQASGFGPDSRPVQNPVSDQLAYLSQRPDASRRTGGALVIYDDTSTLPDSPLGQRGVPYLARDLRWSPDGQRLLLITEDGLILVDLTESSATRWNEEPVPPSAAAFSPDGRAIAYAAPDEVGVFQIVVERLQAERRTRQLTQHAAGTIADVHWITIPRE